MAIVSKDLIVIWSLFQIVGTATHEAHLPRLSLVLRTKCCLETNDLRVLGISEKCSRLTKYVLYNFSSHILKSCKLVRPTMTVVCVQRTARTSHLKTLLGESSGQANTAINAASWL